MAWIFKKRTGVLDLTENYKRQKDKAPVEKAEQKEESSVFSGGIGIFGMATPTPSTTNSDSGYVDVSSEEDKKRKFAKRLMDITDRLESLSNQIYHLQQRVELLEKKNQSGY